VAAFMVSSFGVDGMCASMEGSIGSDPGRRDPIATDRHARATNCIRLRQTPAAAGAHAPESGASQLPGLR